MATNLKEQQLGQLHPTNTNAASVYSPAANVTAIIKNVTICNPSNAAATFSIYMDNDGTTYDNTTVLYNQIPITSNQTISIDTTWAMNNSDGNLAYKSNTANATTITVFGAEIT